MKILSFLRSNPGLNYVCLLHGINQTEVEFQNGMELFKNDWEIGKTLITYLRLAPDRIVSQDKILDSDLVDDTAKRFINSPDNALAELQKLYNGYDKLTDNNLIDISMWAAYFGDPEFAMTDLR